MSIVGKCLVFSSLLMAQFQVSPMIVENFIHNNETGTTTIEVKNNNSDPLQLNVYLKDKAFIDGTEAEELPGTFEKSCADWIFFTPRILNLGPRETQTVRVNINVPDSAKGTYWSNLFIEETSTPKPRVHKIGGHTFNLSINMRMGVLITQTVPGTSIKSGIIDSIDFKYNEDKTAGLIDFSFYNNGNAISYCTGWIEFRDIDGLTVDKIELEDIPKIFPMERRKFRIEIPQNLPTGEYSALTIIDYGGSQLVAGEIIFNYSQVDEKN